ncbi:hypothetical protein GCM10010182_61370 [Actinomadura cremea]|nr:hypothetical protein GCM10010182_61370 [Actinomadura cremea]
MASLPPAEDLPTGSAFTEAWVAPDGPTEPSGAQPTTDPALLPVPPGQPTAALKAQVTNRYAIVALITGFTGLLVLAIGFGIIALVQIRRRGQKGAGLAIGGVAAGTVWTAAGLAVVTSSLLSVDRENTALASEPRAGECFIEPDGLSDGHQVKVVPCRSPHNAEVLSTALAPDGPYPGDESMKMWAAGACDPAFARIETSRNYRYLDLLTTEPDRESWGEGDRRVSCYVWYRTSGPLTEPMDRTLDPGLKRLRDLAAGDCFLGWTDGSAAVRIVVCTKPHSHQVYAVRTLKGGRAHPGSAEIEQHAYEACRKALDEVYRERRPPEQVFFLFPDERLWMAGSRTVHCLVTGGDSLLLKSVVP